jgi:UDP-N-acetylglucosamine 2-epimerase (non-hydrolysing)
MGIFGKAKVLTVVGARPNFMKAAPIIAAIRNHNDRLATSPGPMSLGHSQIAIESVLVHTGQHYDEAMSDRFFADLNIPKPNVHLGAGSGSHAAQTAEIMKRFEEVLLREQPNLLIVVGDVNSTLACALVAAKISYDTCGTRPLIAHVEAGLRSFDRCMPEEINRILTDHLADLLFVTEESGLRNLRQEGIPDHKMHLVGNTMIDSLFEFKHKAGLSHVLDTLGLSGSGSGLKSDSGPKSGNEVGSYALLTLHRPSNVDQRECFLNILQGLEELACTCPVIFPAHPRTQKKIADFGFERFFCLQNQPDEAATPVSISANGRIFLVDPLGYIDFLCLMQHATVVVTDSGGIQEETTALGVPCVTVRENTERPITIQVGTNVLAGTSVEGIRHATRRQLESKAEGNLPEAWDGKSAQRILDVICLEIEKKQAARISYTCEPTPKTATVGRT